MNERSHPDIGVDARGAFGVQIGDGGSQHNEYHLHPRQIEWPHRVGVVPPLADQRVDRPADRDLDTASTSGQTVVVCQVVTGLGGVGKTQLAAALAHHVWDEHLVDLLVWVTATSRTGIIAGYAQAAADVTGVEDADPQQAAERFLAWLAGTDRRWLIVLDDLTDPADLRRLWPPAMESGRTVVTTRRRDSALLAGRHVVQVGLFTPAEAYIYLQNKLFADPRLLAGAAELADDLGHLPLALAQAAAYLLDRGLTCADYRARLADQRRRLPDVLPEAGALPDEHQHTIAATWSLSIDLADRLHPPQLARPVLQLAALLDPNGIPTDLFATTRVLDYLSQRLHRGGVVDAEDVRDALHGLHRLNLATVGRTTDTLRVHALVQRAVREAADAEDTDTLAVTAAEALLEIWPEIEPDQQAAQALRANTAALYNAASTSLCNRDDGAHLVLFQAGNSLGNTGQVSAARNYFHFLHTTTTTHLGGDHPDTLAARHSLAYWRGEAGDPTGAATAFEQLLADRLRILGSDHPSTLTTRANLAYWRGVVGDPAGAAAAFEQLLADRLRILGPDHPDTLAARAQLARWRGVVGDPAVAATAFEQLLADRLRVLGSDHPSTLTTRSNLAFWRGEAGDPAGAASALEQLFVDRLRVLGSDHPDTLTTRHSLAHWRGEAGDPADAASTLEQVLADQLRVLGSDHPSTLTTRHNLAYWRGEAGDPAGAAAAFEQLLADRLRVLGPDHPSTLTTRADLAYWRDNRNGADTA
ncbi:tetratricopeptide repeat protein [Actinoplanes sp. CA-131856]